MPLSSAEGVTFKTLKKPTTNEGTHRAVCGPIFRLKVEPLRRLPIQLRCDYRTLGRGHNAAAILRSGMIEIFISLYVSFWGPAFSFYPASRD